MDEFSSQNSRWNMIMQIIFILKLKMHKLCWVKRKLINILIVKNQAVKISYENSFMEVDWF